MMWQMFLNSSTSVWKISRIWKTKFPYNYFYGNRNATKYREPFFHVWAETRFSISVILVKKLKLRNIAQTAESKEKIFLIAQKEHWYYREINMPYRVIFICSWRTKMMLVLNQFRNAIHRKKLLHKTVRLSSSESSWQNRFIKSVKLAI